MYLRRVVAAAVCAAVTAAGMALCCVGWRGANTMGVAAGCCTTCGCGTVCAAGAATACAACATGCNCMGSGMGVNVAAPAPTGAPRNGQAAATGRR